MINVERLRKRLNDEHPRRSKKFTNTDIAEALGYSRTQIFDAVKKGKEPARLARACEMALLLMDTMGSDALFRWMSSTDIETEKSLFHDPERASKQLNQMDLVEEYHGHYGFQSPLTLDMLREDIENGHIAEGFDELVCKLVEMFPRQDDYEFNQVRAALVALASPDMVTKNPETEQKNHSNMTEIMLVKNQLRDMNGAKSLYDSQLLEVSEKVVALGYTAESDHLMSALSSEVDFSHFLNQRVLKRFAETAVK